MYLLEIGMCILRRTRIDEGAWLRPSERVQLDGEGAPAKNRTREFYEEGLAVEIYALNNT